VLHPQKRRQYCLRLLHVRIAQTQPIWKLFWVKKKRLLKIVWMGTEACILLIHQPMDPIYTELPVILLVSL